MDKTPFSEKIATLALAYEHDEPKDFLSYYDVGVPAAYLIHHGLVKSPSKECVDAIDQAYAALTNIT
jgi:hypothetical protein